MLSKSSRFTFKSKLPKNTLNSNSFSIRYDTNEEGLKVAVVVSKKVDKRAVVRNRIKRVILETVRKNLGPNSNLTLIFYARVQAVDNKALAEEVKSTISQLKQND